MTSTAHDVVGDVGRHGANILMITLPRGRDKPHGALAFMLVFLFRNQLRCPHCNESTALEYQHTSRHVTDHRSQLD